MIKSNFIILTISCLMFVMLSACSSLEMDDESLDEEEVVELPTAVIQSVYQFEKNIQTYLRIGF